LPDETQRLSFKSEKRGGGRLPRFSVVTLSSNPGGVSVPGKPPPAPRESQISFGPRQRVIQPRMCSAHIIWIIQELWIDCKEAVSEVLAGKKRCSTEYTSLVDQQVIQEKMQPGFRADILFRSGQESNFSTGIFQPGTQDYIVYLLA